MLNDGFDLNGQLYGLLIDWQVFVMHRHSHKSICKYQKARINSLSSVHIVRTVHLPEVNFAACREDLLRLAGVARADRH